MKKYLLALLVLGLVVSVSGCTTNSDENSNATKTLSQNNVSFTYPATWVLGNSKANDTVAAVADPKSLNASGYAQTVVSVQRKNLTGTLDAMYQDNYNNLFNNTNYTRVSEGNLTLDNIQGMENVYTVKENGVEKTQRAIWVQRGKQVYVVLFTALSSQYDAQKQDFDLILNSLQIQ